MSDLPLLKVNALSKFYGSRIGCQNVTFELWPGEVLAIVGEFWFGKDHASELSGDASRTFRRLGGIPHA